MAYIGPGSSSEFKSMATQTITGDGSAQSFTLDQSVSDSSSVRFVVNNVVQKPDVDYSASGTSLSTGSSTVPSLSSWIENISKIYSACVS